MPGALRLRGHVRRGAVLLRGSDHQDLAAGGVRRGRRVVGGGAGRANRPLPLPGRGGIEGERGAHHTHDAPGEHKQSLLPLQAVIHRHLSANTWNSAFCTFLISGISSPNA